MGWLIDSGGSEMKKFYIIILILIFVFSLCACGDNNSESSANESSTNESSNNVEQLNDDVFIDNLGDALEARWELSKNYTEDQFNRMSKEELQSVYTSFLDAEVNVVGTYDIYSFEKDAVKEQAELYFKGLELQKEGLQYVGTDDYTSYHNTWEMGYYYRAASVRELFRKYGLTVSYDYKQDLADFAAVGEEAQKYISDEQEDTPSKAEATLPETLIYDSNGVTVKVLGFSSDSFGKNVDLEIINNSDVDISWNVNDFIINDVTVICAFVYDIPAGKTAIANYPIDSDDLVRYGIEDIYTVAISSELTNSDTYEVIDYSMSDRIATSLGSDFSPVLPLDKWNEVYSSDSLKVIYTGIIENNDDDYHDDFETKAIFFAYNNTDSVISVGPEDVSFDDSMDYSNYTVFSVGPYAYGEFYVTCEDDDINNKSEMEFVVGVSDGNTYSEQYQTPIITVSVH